MSDSTRPADRPTLSATEDVPLTFATDPDAGVAHGGASADDVTVRLADEVSLRLADGPGTWVETDIAAPIDAVWDLVSDIDVPGRFSAEFLGARWEGDGPALGAGFVGRNTHPDVGEWEITSYLHAYEPGRSFGWATVDLANPGSRWRFDLEPTDVGTCLRFALSLGPGPSFLTIVIDKMPDKEDRIIRRRLREHHANMARTVAGIAALAEGRPVDGTATAANATAANATAATDATSGDRAGES